MILVHKGCLALYSCFCFSVSIVNETALHGTPKMEVAIVLFFLLLLNSALCALLAPELCTQFFTYPRLLHSVRYLLLTCTLCTLLTADHCTLYAVYSYPLHPVHYLLLTSQLCILLTPGLCSLCITYFWPLNPVYITYSWSLLPVWYLLLNLHLHYLLLTSTFNVILTPGLCTPCSAYS